MMVFLTDRQECPLCAGRGTARGRAFQRDAPTQYGCGLCGGRGSVRREQIADLQDLREQMQRVADLMQAGDGDGAAAAVRDAVRISRRMVAKPLH